MGINYNPSKWENGKTVIKASHFEKIEKGITDIINYNNSIYIDEDKRKENEIKREEEHNKKLEEINSSIKDIQADYDSLQKVIIDENASANLQNQINDVTSQLAHIEKQIKVLTPEMFGAKGDGLNDDTQPIQDSFEYILSHSNSKIFKLELNGIYRTTKKISIDMNKIPCSIVVNGYLKCENDGIFITNALNSCFKIKFKDGGNSQSKAFEISKSVNIELDIEGNNYNGLLLKISGNSRDKNGCYNFKVNSLNSFRCKQALIHGDDVEGCTQQMFGQYTSIIDTDSKEGIVFQNSNDITILHIENHYYNEVNYGNSIEVKNCGCVYFGNLAIGGSCKNLLYIKNSSVFTNRVYVCCEDSMNDLDNKTIGICIDGYNIFTSDLIYDLGCYIVLDIKNKNSSSNIDVKYLFTGIGANYQKMLVIDGIAQSQIKYFGSYHSNDKNIIVRECSVNGNTTVTGELTLKNNINTHNIMNLNNPNNPNNKLFTIGVNKDDLTYRIESYDKDTGSWNNIPFLIDANGTRVSIGSNNSFVGFYGNYGAKQQTISPNATDLNSVITLANNIKTILLTLGLVK